MPAAMVYNALLEEKRLKPFQLEKKLGLSSGAVRKAIARNSSISMETATKIKQFYPEYTIEWLMTGLGNKEDLVLNSIPNDANEKKIPFYDAPATAGSADTDMMPVTKPSGFISPGTVLGACTSAIRIFGNSMLEGYPSGTILGLVEDFDRFIVPGNLYVLETRSQRLFKRMFVDLENEDILICYSDNKHCFPDGALKGLPYYPPFKVHKEEITRKFIVTGSAREHTNSLIVDYDKQ
jgi:plasmid maintenance system antidote protein VapI